MHADPVDLKPIQLHWTSWTSEDIGCGATVSDRLLCFGDKPEQAAVQIMSSTVEGKTRFSGTLWLEHWDEWHTWDRQSQAEVLDAMVCLVAHQIEDLQAVKKCLEQELQRHTTPSRDPNVICPVEEIQEK